MNYGLTATPAVNDTECLVIGVCSDNNLPDFAAELNKQHDGLIERLASKLCENGDTAWQTDFDGRSLLFIHCGNKANYTADVLSKRIVDIAALLSKASRIHHTPLNPLFFFYPAQPIQPSSLLKPLRVAFNSREHWPITQRTSARQPTLQMRPSNWRTGMQN